MCHPCYHNLKRAVLDNIASHLVGQSFIMPDYSWTTRPIRATVVARQQEADGVLVFLRIDDLTHWSEGIRPFWCPQYGSGGWVDTQKDLKVDALLNNLVAHHIREAENCMAL